MSGKRWGLGCLLIPSVLVSSCFGKMYVDSRLYNLPGRVLASDRAPTQQLASALDVARSLDTYVQPRFEILRDKNFGAFRIVYRKHAGLAQLKVESAREKELIANVNAAKRDYAICLLHCIPKPEPDWRDRSLQLLYFNQTALIRDSKYSGASRMDLEELKDRGFRLDPIRHRALEAMDALLAGKERQARSGDWDILMRPVLATQKSCLGCHKEATPGSTLGAMVYAVRRTPRQNASPTAAGQPDQRRTAWASRM